MSVLSSVDFEKLTPMMKQYYALKKRCQGAILFFRMGDFYEIFGEDANIAAPLLEIVLTSRERGDKKKIPFCGVPYHSARSYWHKLLRKNYKVAIADQMEEASATKGIVRRDITKIMTPGCVDELEGLHQGVPNYIMGVYEHPEKRHWVLCLADVSTGELRLGKVESFEDAVKFIHQLGPKELLVRRFCEKRFSEKLKSSFLTEAITIGLLNESILRDVEKQKELLAGSLGPGGLGLHPSGNLVGGEELISALLDHFQNLQLSLKPFRSVKPLVDPKTIRLDNIVVRDLELLQTARMQDEKGSLLRQINFTQTPMGSRLLRWSLLNPLVDFKEIVKRHKIVAELIELGSSKVNELRKTLQGSSDLMRLSTRILSKNIRPQELSRFKSSLTKIDNLFHKLDLFSKEAKLQTIEKLKKDFSLVKPILTLLNQSLNDEAGSLKLMGDVIATGFDSKLDQHRDLASRGEEEVSSYQEKLRLDTKISNLKIKPHKTYGLLIEVTKSHSSKVPDSFIRRQTMVNCERFTTEDLKDLDDKVSNAKDYALQREEELYFDLLDHLSRHQEQVCLVSESLSFFDLMVSFAWGAMENMYCQPKLNQHRALIIKNSRHPVVEHFVGKKDFVVNDMVFDERKKIMLITGPNMAGKSTIMRQTALIAILSQIGSYVPASSAELPVFDNIFTRVGASDDLSRGLSTFMVEMQEVAHMMRFATPKSLVILDEVGRGTSTEDGLAIASSILDSLAKDVNAWTMFATHYHELVPFSSVYPNIIQMQTEVTKDRKEIQFTHKLIEGACGSSYGLEVARLAGISNLLIENAKGFLELQVSKNCVPEEKEPKEEVQDKVQNLHNDIGDEIMNRLNNLKLNRITPLQALNILHDLVLRTKKAPTNSLFHDGQLLL